MTARDTASDTVSGADPTDAVVTDPAATGDARDTDDAGAATGPSATSDAKATDADAKAADAEAADATAADADATDTDPAVATGKKARQRRGKAGRDDATDSAADGEDAATASRPGPSRRTRWVVTALLLVSVLFAGAMAGLYVADRPSPIAGLSSSQQAAVDAATQAAVNLQTFRRASFDQDFANALASLTPEFAQQQLAPRKDALKTQLTQGGRDASATALSAGIVSSTSTEAVVLVVTNTTQTADDGTSTPFVFSRLQLTLDHQNGKWLVSDLKSVGLS